MRSQTIKHAKSHFSWPHPCKTSLNARLACANGTYRVHHRFRDLDEGGWVDVLQLGAVDQGVGEVDESSVIDYEHREGKQSVQDRTITDSDRSFSVPFRSVEILWQAAGLFYLWDSVIWDTAGEWFPSSLWLNALRCEKTEEKGTTVAPIASKNRL